MGRCIRKRSVASMALLAAVVGCATTRSERGLAADESAHERVLRSQVETVLDDFHLAASQADGERYFGHLAPEAVFYGTDPAERWSKAEFQAYAHPYFSTGRGWTYTVTERHVGFDDDRNCAWFDERLSNAKYGETRGTGALILRDGRWRIVLYDLSIPVPNELSLELVERVRELAEQ